MSLYTCFVNFRTAFDSVWVEGLKHKLEKTGTTGKFLRVVNFMYQSTPLSLIYKDKSKESFPTTAGLKQRIS